MPKIGQAGDWSDGSYLGLRDFGRMIVTLRLRVTHDEIEAIRRGGKLEACGPVVEACGPVLELGVQSVWPAAESMGKKRAALFGQPQVFRLFGEEHNVFVETLLGLTD